MVEIDVCVKQRVGSNEKTSASADLDLHIVLPPATIETKASQDNVSVGRESDGLTAGVGVTPATPMSWERRKGGRMKMVPASGFTERLYPYFLLPQNYHHTGHHAGLSNYISHTLVIV